MLFFRVVSCKKRDKNYFSRKKHTLSYTIAKVLLPLYDVLTLCSKSHCRNKLKIT